MNGCVGCFCAPGAAALPLPSRNARGPVCAAKTWQRKQAGASRARRANVVCAVAGNGSSGYVAPAENRVAQVARTTNETEVSVSVNLDGTGKCDVDTGIGFLDHMLNQLSSHGLLDLNIRARGDYHIDDHHTNEDVGITLGMAIAKALGDKKGIRRFGHFIAPLDEALVEVVLDFSGRPHLEYGLKIPTERIGKFDTQLVREFYSAVAGNAQITIHVRQLSGINSHHIVEASFKAFARAMRMALELDPRRLGGIPSSKGVLTDAQGLEQAKTQSMNH
ncbi:Imidazoleglycerol-phosphate dehydratase [Porphyridium purpureum]|uniref:Imidazoleglycerol-phosphate dehydratase n=1 Tax=Porphyridium purpureum TaxID=35688 RepID=A0A5J4YYU8_PORPP|nr:Imidazoleglycerol-phosphate dehydratase [Porphyridium purpureum]|eukprot:POR3953..scf209_3